MNRPAIIDGFYRGDPFTNKVGNALRAYVKELEMHNAFLKKELGVVEDVSYVEPEYEPIVFEEEDVPFVRPKVIGRVDHAAL